MRTHKIKIHLKILQRFEKKKPDKLPVKSFKNSLIAMNNPSGRYTALQEKKGCLAILDWNLIKTPGGSRGSVCSVAFWVSAHCNGTLMGKPRG